MPVAAWIDQLAADLLTTADALRGLLRRHHYDPPPWGTQLRSQPGAQIAITAHEARTLLRAAQPLPQRARPLRENHAKLLAAISTCAELLLAANEPIAGGPVAIEAGLELRAALDAWILRARWQQATSRAHIAWPGQPARSELPISALPRQSTGDFMERSTNPGLLEDQPATPDRRATRARRPTAPLPSQRELLLPIGSSSPATPRQVDLVDSDRADEVPTETRIKAAG